MTVQYALGIGKPNSQIPFEPGFIERGYLVCSSQLLKLSDQVLLPGFFRLELREEGVHRLTFSNRVDQVLFVGFNQRQLGTTWKLIGS